MTSPLPRAADLYCDIEPPVRTGWRKRLYGLTVVAAATLAAAYIADRYGAPLTLIALLVGLALNFLGEDPRLDPGLALVAGPGLRLGIVLLGARVSITQVIALGPQALLVLTGIACLTILTGLLAARRAGRSDDFGLLAGAAVAICGASAALAVAARLGERRLGKAELAQVLVGIAVVSAAAMFLYPILAHFLHLSDRQAGFVLGASIHDVAQALGAGYSFSREAGDTSAIVKLSRVALLVPVLMLIGLRLNGGATGKAAPRPWFVAGFFAMMILSSFLHLPAPLAGGIQLVSAMLLAAAVTATGIRAPLSAMRERGWRAPLAIILASSMVALALALIASLVIWR
ncbi:conserved hypothetical integral membrane protein [Novosphingobium sp. CF614]|uniref:YeiH family protein n=1 Tax=Novosphingobium sp. CF614 TaxID=1884364 RepID=UPI0008EF01CC|nr:putative sulfate exporter family transporter [Novosphingobium sp. CF614]SFF82709.1 conserved hypothetical integral membrane protein [Novosphingobium sp. CF614]